MNTQMSSTVRKIHNLLSSGAVTVSGPNQPRVLKQKVAGTNMVSNAVPPVGGGGGTINVAVGGHAVAAPPSLTVTNSTNVNTAANNNSVQQLAMTATTMVNHNNRCYICDDHMSNNHIQHPFTEMVSTHTSTKFPNKIGQLVGDSFMVIVSVDDVICTRCTNLINYLDRLENDVERVKSNILNLLHKKYGINDDNRNNLSTIGLMTTPANISNNTSNNTIVTLPNTSTSITSYVSTTAPPNKLQKLNSGASAGQYFPLFPFHLIFNPLIFIP